MVSLQSVLDSLVDKNIIVFDGECVLCNHFFHFVVAIDRKQRFHFLTAQSPAGEILYQHFGLKQGDFDTSLVLVNGELFERMHGFYKVMKIIGLPWSLLSVFGWLPKVINDFGYNLVARNRYRIFGRREYCMIPSEELKSRFLD